MLNNRRITNYANRDVKKICNSNVAVNINVVRQEAYLQTKSVKDGSNDELKICSYCMQKNLHLPIVVL